MMFIIVAVFLPFATLILLRLYCRATLGICDSRQDMTGKTVLITGATRGVGKCTAFDLAQRNARVILACRNLKEAEKVKSEITSLTGNTNIVVKHLDLASFSSARMCAQDILRTEERLDVLINNAGTSESGLQITKDGCEKHMQINHLGPFLLTLLLLDLLKRSQPSRIINISSAMCNFGVLDMDDMNGNRQSSFLTNMNNFYHRSKLANIWFTIELARRLAGTGVTVNAAHPGLVLTDIFYNYNSLLMFAWRFLLFFLGKSQEEGAQTSIYLAVHPEVQNVTGKYFSDCRERSVLLTPHVKDRKKARKFFEISEKIVGETFQNINKDT